MISGTWTGVRSRLSSVDSKGNADFKCWTPFLTACPSVPVNSPPCGPPKGWSRCALWQRSASSVPGRLGLGLGGRRSVVRRTPFADAWTTSARGPGCRSGIRAGTGNCSLPTRPGWRGCATCSGPGCLSGWSVSWPTGPRTRSSGTPTAWPFTLGWSRRGGFSAAPGMTCALGRPGLPPSVGSGRRAGGHGGTLRSYCGPVRQRASRPSARRGTSGPARYVSSSPTLLARAVLVVGGGAGHVGMRYMSCTHVLLAQLCCYITSAWSWCTG